MNIPFNAPGRQYQILKGEIDRAIASVLESGWYLLGEETTTFEQEFAAFCGVAHCITLASGTDALELALRGTRCRPGLEVITAANAGGYTTYACNIVGATPVYVDIDPKFLQMDLEAAVAAVTERTACIVVTHLYGFAVDVPLLRRLLEAAGRSSVPIIEDCAQAHGAILHGRRVGSFGDLAAFSFYPTKNLGALGDGGALLCNDEEYANKIRQLKQYGWVSKYRSETPFGRNSRLDEIQAAVLRVKLRHLDRLNMRRVEIVEAYREAAEGKLTILSRTDGAFVGHLCVALSDDRDHIRERLEEVGIQTDIHYPILDPDQQIMKKITHITHRLARSRESVKRVFSLPCYSELSDGERDTICETLSRLVG